MSSLTQLLVLLAVIWLLAYRRARMGTILGALAVALGLMTWYGGIAWLLWILLGGVAVFYFEDKLRRERLSRPVFEFFKRVLPPMSDTEQEALEAGDTWWDADLFKGAPDWKKWLQLPFPQLSEEEEAFLENQTETLCEMISDWDIVHVDKDLPPQAWDYLKKEKFFGMIIPKEYGGLGFSALAHSTIVTKIATRSASAAVTARGEPSSFEWLAKTKARSNWRHRVRLTPELGPDFSDWKAAADIDESCLVGPDGTVCTLTARPCRKK